jgi:hypothetical protein
MYKWKPRNNPFNNNMQQNQQAEEQNNKVYRESEHKKITESNCERSHNLLLLSWHPEHSRDNKIEWNKNWS